MTNNTPTVPLADEEITNDVDEPPDDRVPELNNNFKKEESYKASRMPNLPRRESLLTRAFKSEHDTSPTSPRFSEVPRGLSTTSSHSFASTAELTSDVESPLRSATPSPPPPMHHLQLTTSTKTIDPTKIIIAPLSKDDKLVHTEHGEAAVEKTLGRKRCIMFACKETSVEEEKSKPVEAPKPAPRKCMISFACPMKPEKEAKDSQESKDQQKSLSHAAAKQPATNPATRSEIVSELRNETKHRSPTSPVSPQQPFHEFGNSGDDTEDWVEKASEASKPKLTINDCLKKENAIRKLGEEAEEEADEEEREQDELENELDDEEDQGEDDFAPSDEEESTDGNESDDEGGFADSDDESDAGSDYQFWRPQTSPSRLAAPDNMSYFSARQHSRSRASSTSSAHSVQDLETMRRNVTKPKASKPIRMRPGTPELPDSTDFVCGTLDEDRPMEAAYISCREQRRRLRHVPIPQDIDPSFPTTDPEDQEEDEEEAQDAADSSDQMWMKHQFEGFDDDVRGRQSSAVRVSPLHSPTPVIAPPRPVRPQPAMRPTLRSPPPKQKLHRSPPPKQRVSKSPAPRRLFDQAPKRLRSPPPAVRLRSPRGSPTDASKLAPFGITINHLALRPKAEMTASLPHTPNPYFRNWRNGQQHPSRIAAAAVPSGPEPARDLHVRGPVDIVIGLEKKRQKRKEKFWRQHCRKAAKEHAEKRPAPGRGAERMKELGLECAERNRGYGLGQQAHVVLSL